jgi:hypothetical protein
MGFFGAADQIRLKQNKKKEKRQPYIFHAMPPDEKYSTSLVYTKFVPAVVLF